MALVGLVRVSTQAQEIARQHDALDDICVKVFEEKISGKLAAAERPGLQAAIDYMRPGDMLCVQEADRLGRNLLEGLIVLNDLFEQGVAVKILEGIAAGEHTERSLILDLALALAEDRRRDISRKTRNGLEAAARRGRKGGRPRVVDEDKRRVILARRAEGQSLRQIADAVKVSLGVVHAEITAAETSPDPLQEVIVLPGVRAPLPVDPRDDQPLTDTAKPTTGHAPESVPAPEPVVQPAPGLIERDGSPAAPAVEAARAPAQSLVPAAAPRAPKAPRRRRPSWEQQMRTSDAASVRELVDVVKDEHGVHRVTDHDGTYLGRVAREARLGGGRGRWFAWYDTGNKLPGRGWDSREKAVTGLLLAHDDRNAVRADRAERDRKTRWAVEL